MDTRFVVTADGIRDASTGLEWQLRPDDVGLTWLDARVALTRAGWRLPTALELVGFLGDLEQGTAWRPVPPTTFWSSSDSPFAAATQVRVVCCEPEGGLSVVLLARTDLARGWGVRSGGGLNVVQDD